MIYRFADTRLAETAGTTIHTPAYGGSRRADRPANGGVTTDDRLRCRTDRMLPHISVRVQVDGPVHPVGRVL